MTAHGGRAARQGGQALVLGMVLLAAAVAALAGMHRLGRIIDQRVRLTHAADAAAYSGAVLQARRLNAIAYANRSQIAHQVAMAHLVTLGAAARYVDSGQTQMLRRNPPAGLLGGLFGVDAGLAYSGMRAIPGAEQSLADSLARHDRIAHGILSEAAAAQAGSMIADRDRIMLQVLRAQLLPAPGSARLDAAVLDGLSLRVQNDAAPGYLEQVAPRDGAGLQAASRAAAERHDFLAPRVLSRDSAVALLPSCPSMRNTLRRRGATWLGPDGRWAAVDTQSYHALRSNRWIGCYLREYPMGWGIALDGASEPPADLIHVDAAPVDFSQQDFWRWVQASTDWDIAGGTENPLGNSYGMAAPRFAAGAGLPRYYEVAAGRTDQALRFVVQARWNVPGLPSLTASSAAETYFVRPEPRADGKGERATLFRPYWQARLVASGPVAAASLRGRP